MKKEVLALSQRKDSLEVLYNSLFTFGMLSKAGPKLGCLTY